MGNHLYTFSLLTVLLLPLSGLYWLLYKIHKFLYTAGILKVQRVGAAVIVVGNLTVGGTGKTPLVAWLAQYLQEKGFKPGIISRGYRGNHQHPVLKVGTTTDPAACGDEPLWLASHTGLPVYVGKDRVAVAHSLLQNTDCNVLISDDGLQHHRLYRDIEIIVIDGWRRFGNGLLLPAGPLRETSARLNLAEFVLCRGGIPTGKEIPYRYEVTGFRNIVSGEVVDQSRFAGQTVHAVAAIGNPEQFFQIFNKIGVGSINHAFPDHHHFSSADLDFGDELAVIMTEKDAVKCEKLSEENWWAVMIEPDLPEEFGINIVTRLKEVIDNG